MKVSIAGRLGGGHSLGKEGYCVCVRRAAKLALTTTKVSALHRVNLQCLFLITDRTVGSWVLVLSDFLSSFLVNDADGLCSCYLLPSASTTADVHRYRYSRAHKHTGRECETEIFTMVCFIYTNLFICISKSPGALVFL